VFIGAVVRVVYLPDAGNFKLFAACVLFYIGARMIYDMLKKTKPGNNHKQGSEQRFQQLVRDHRAAARSVGQSKSEPLPAVQVTHFNLKRMGYTFYGESFDVSFWGIFALSFIVGIVGGIYGIGGGAIIAPFFVTFFGLPVYTVAGAALMGTFVTSVAGVAFYQGLAPFYPGMSIAPDWLLGLLFGVGGMAGMYMGARFQKFVPAGVIKWMLASIIVFTALKYAAGFFIGG
jgi:uncharacterized protein